MNGLHIEIATSQRGKFRVYIVNRAFQKLAVGAQTGSWHVAEQTARRVAEIVGAVYERQEPKGAAS